MKDFKTKITKYRRVMTMIIIDGITAITCFLLANLLFFNTYAMNLNFQIFEFYSPIFAGIVIATFLFLGVYKTIWRYADVEQFMFVIIVSAFAGLVFMLLLINTFGPFIVNIAIANIMISSLSFVFLRMVYRLYRRGLVYTKAAPSVERRKKIAIIGAGQAGMIMQQEIAKSSNSEYEVVCIIDDDSEKIGRKIDRVKIEGPISNMKNIGKKYDVEVIIVAIPSASDEKRKEILKLSAGTGLEVKYLPKIYGVIEEFNENILHKLKKVSIEDLLGREEIQLEDDDIRTYIKGKRVLVTGGGGSIGSELCRQVISYQPKELIIVDSYENGAYELQMELQEKYSKIIPIDVLIGSVRDRDRLLSIFKRKKPEIVFHAAAHKHVPLMEISPEEAVKNNILGTKNTMDVAEETGVDKFVLISTDKAVNPTNVMGATKRFAEMLLQSKNRKSQTDFVAVRFGNVLGSNGSVIPLFKRQIEKGGPVTVTHPEITRYFMTIPEAVKLVLKSSVLAKGGEIFVLDMGQPVKIKDLAINLIRLAGLKPEEDIRIEYTGLRPGEKLYEELLIEKNHTDKTKYDKIFIEKKDVQKNSDDIKEPRHVSENIELEDVNINMNLGKLKTIIEMNKEDKEKEIKLTLKEVVKEYEPEF